MDLQTNSGYFDNIVNFYLRYIKEKRGHKIMSVEQDYNACGFYPLSVIDAKDCWIFSGNLIFDKNILNIGISDYYIYNIIDEMGYSLNIYKADANDVNSHIIHFPALITCGIQSYLPYNTSGLCVRVKTDKYFF